MEKEITINLRQPVNFLGVLLIVLSKKFGKQESNKPNQLKFVTKELNEKEINQFITQNLGVQLVSMKIKDL